MLELFYHFNLGMIISQLRIIKNDEFVSKGASFVISHLWRIILSYKIYLEIFLPYGDFWLVTIFRYLGLDRHTNYFETIALEVQRAIQISRKHFFVLIWNRWIRTGSHQYEKTMSSINYIQFYTNIKCTIIRFFSLRHLGAKNLLIL